MKAAIAAARAAKDGYSSAPELFDPRETPPIAVGQSYRGRRFPVEIPAISEAAQ
jgi:hypothetical protein